jgi:hypothetical protein
MLAACNLDFPTNSLSASAVRYSKGNPEQKWNLTEQKVRELHEWFSRHQDGWSVSYVTFVPVTLVTLTHAGDVRSSVNVLRGGHIVVNTSDHQFIQKFEESEVKSLVAIIEPSKQ